MIVSHKHKFVYLNIGKTGSISIGSTFEQQFEGFVWRKWHPSARFPKCAPQHVCHLPEELSDYFVIASIRNPFTHELSRHTHGPKESGRPDTMDCFKEWLNRNWMETFHSKLNMNEDYNPPKGCVKFKVDHLIRLESIENDFNKLPFITTPIRIKHRNKSQKDQTRLYYTEEMAERVRQKRAIDFELFGYSLELPKEMKRIPCL